MSHRKIILLAILSLCFAVSNARAQGRTEITPFGGTRFGGVVDITSNNVQNADYLNIKSTWDYGVMLDYTLLPKFQAEFMWNRQPTYSTPTPSSARRTRHWTCTSSAAYMSSVTAIQK